MNPQEPAETKASPQSHSELLILPDGRILVHNLTQTMAEVLRELNPCEDAMRPRAEAKKELLNTCPLVA